ncbi:MAG: methyltransferase domain-containing protein [Gammaproteobacteria bacterium]|nr:methyltransferase domain-containing protein [Gammaproteobacteria bacterium]
MEATEWRLPDLTDALSRLSRAKLFIDPLLLGMSGAFVMESADPVLRAGAEKLKREYDADPQAKALVRDGLFGPHPSNDELVYVAIDEFLICTAIYLSHDINGTVDVDQGIAQMTVNDVTAFIERNGLLMLCQCHAAIVGLENNQAVAYYGRLSVKDFLSGAKHRPWATKSLPHELELSNHLGFYETFSEDDTEYVRLTDKGFDRMHQIRSMMEHSGYIASRLRAMYLAQFDDSQDWDGMLREICPTLIDERRKFLDFLSLQASTEVLELGCGTGEFTFTAGLCDAVGENGFVTATDPSVGMLRRAQAKQDALGAKRVALEAAMAESIPFSDSEFDAVVGVSFLQFTEMDAAMKEMVRVSRNGATVGIFQPIAATSFTPVYREWFQVFFDLAKRSGSESPPSYLPGVVDLTQLFERYSLHSIETKVCTVPVMLKTPETVVRFLLTTVGFFQKQMMSIPWAARVELVSNLVEKGVEMCSRYPLVDRTFPASVLFIKGIVQKA